MTAYVLRTGRPLWASPEKVIELTAQGEAEDLGAPSVDWMRVPLQIDGKILGAMVMESHPVGIRISVMDLNSLTLVSNQVAVAINCKRAEESRKLPQFSIDHADRIFKMRDKGRPAYANDVACQFLGYTREERLSLTAQDVDPNLAREAWPNYFNQLCQFGSLTNESTRVTKNQSLSTQRSRAIA